MEPGVVVPVAGIFMIVAITVGLPLVRAIAKRWENESRREIPPEVMSRLERMEHAIDSIAVEVERISEGQRFTTKLLSESHKGSALPAVRDFSRDAN